MVAHAFVPSFFASEAEAITSRPAVRGAVPESETVKLLDLLTNRYHVGLVRANSGSVMELELPLTSHLHAGQRVRFVVAGEKPLVSRGAMRGACITHIDRAGANRLRVELALSDAEAAAA